MQSPCCGLLFRNFSRIHLSSVVVAPLSGRFSSHFELLHHRLLTGKVILALVAGVFLPLVDSTCASGAIEIFPPVLAASAVLFAMCFFAIAITPDGCDSRFAMPLSVSLCFTFFSSSIMLFCHSDVTKLFILGRVPSPYVRGRVLNRKDLLRNSDIRSFRN